MKVLAELLGYGAASVIIAIVIAAILSAPWLFILNADERLREAGGGITFGGSLLLWIIAGGLASNSDATVSWRPWCYAASSWTLYAALASSAAFLIRKRRITGMA